MNIPKMTLEEMIARTSRTFLLQELSHQAGDPCASG